MDRVKRDRIWSVHVQSIECRDWGYLRVMERDWQSVIIKDRLRMQLEVRECREHRDCVLEWAIVHIDVMSPICRLIQFEVFVSNNVVDMVMNESLSKFDHYSK